MATKSKLDTAVEQQASRLNGAQREIVLSQYRDYKKNLDRVSRIEEELSLASSGPLVPALKRERLELLKLNNEMAANLFRQLAGGEEARDGL